MVNGEGPEVAAGDDPGLWDQVEEAVACSVGYGNFLDVGIGDGPGVEAQVKDDIG